MENLVLKEDGAEFWNQNPCGGDWESYKLFYEWIQKTEPYFYEIMAAYSFQDKVACDVGCGQGAKSNYMIEQGAQVFGLDMSTASIQQAILGAKELGNAASFRGLQADAEVLPFGDNSFDMVICSGVLHHTPNTEKGVEEIYRILRPNGTAIVMLYRTGNPKWWATSFIRHNSHRFRKNKTGSPVRENDVRGTALLELFGVPILKAYSNQQARKMFYQFGQVKISNHQAGFRRMADIIAFLRPVSPLLQWFDQLVRPVWGFYQVIEARK